MRSRFSAYARGVHDYLFRTLHPDHDNYAAGPAAHAKSMAKHGKSLRYESLVVLDRDGPDADGIARVLFHVSMKQSGKDASFVELSSFAHDGTGFRYVGGEHRARPVVVSGLTIASFASNPEKR
jgi:SEC-C motif domain protein